MTKYEIENNKKYQMIMDKIEELENDDTVVGAIRLDDGTVLCMEEVLIEEEMFNRTVALGTVSVKEYEDNGYELDGLEYTWIRL